MALRKKPVSRRAKTSSGRPALTKQRTKARATSAPRKSEPTPAVAPPALTHIDQRGEARMVDVTDKGATERIAVAEGRVIMRKETLDMVLQGNALKGDVLGAARLAGIMAAKRTHGLIPLCHPLPLTFVEVVLTVDDDGVAIEAAAETVAQTGVEMEALTAVAVAALTVYDMAKAIDKEMRIDGVELVSKTKEPV